MVLENVYLFGDSVARGIILNEEGTYTPIKDYFGALAAEKLGVNLVNKARFGCTITKGLDILRRFVSNASGVFGGSSREDKGAGADPTLAATAREFPKNPGIALLEFGGNDCDFLWNEVAAKPSEEHLPLTPIDLFSSRYGEMIDTLRSNGLIPVSMSLPPLVAERYFDWITRTGLDRGAILSWLGDIQQIFRWHAGYDEAVRKVSAAKACPLLDIRKAFLDKPDYRDYMCDDGIHPNRKGHRLIESTIEEYAVAYA